jgi:hypothetical protein
MAQEEKIVHKPCKAHGHMICTKCEPTKFITPEDSPFYQIYREHWLENGRELCKNHKELKEGLLRL